MVGWHWGDFFFVIVSGAPLCESGFGLYPPLSLSLSLSLPSPLSFSLAYNAYFNPHHPFSLSCLTHADPLQWTKEQVQRWIDWCSKEFGLNNINRQVLQEVTGQQLCTFTNQQFQEVCFIKEHAITLQSFFEQIKRYSTGEFRTIIMYLRERGKGKRENFWCCRLVTFMES